MPKKKKAYDILDEYYIKHRISDKVRNIKVDNDRLDKELSKPDVWTRVDEVYERFNIKRYDTNNGYSDFVNDQANIHPNAPLSAINKLWEEYKHRDDLIISGQYEEFRYKAFRDNYLKAMKNSGLSLEAIKNVEALPLEKWKEIVNVPAPNKNNVKDTLFPKLGGFHYGDTSLKFIRAATEDIKEAFKALGLEYLDTSDVIKSKSIAVAKVKEINIVDNIETAAKIDNVIGLLPKAEREAIENIPYTDKNRTESQLVAIGLAMPRNRVKISKSGNRYIPFVGSTRSGTKNEKITKAILEGFDIYK